MPNTRTWTCVPGQKPPCTYAYLHLACGWWYQSSDEDEACCHSPSPAEREAWQEAEREQTIEQ